MFCVGLGYSNSIRTNNTDKNRRRIRKITKLVLSRETGSVSSGNFSPFEVTDSKAREIVGDATGHARLLILLSLTQSINQSINQ